MRDISTVRMEKAVARHLADIDSYGEHVPIVSFLWVCSSNPWVLRHLEAKEEGPRRKVGDWDRTGGTSQTAW